MLFLVFLCNLYYIVNILVIVCVFVVILLLYLYVGHVKLWYLGFCFMINFCLGCMLFCVVLCCFALLFCVLSVVAWCCFLLVVLVEFGLGCKVFYWMNICGGFVLYYFYVLGMWRFLRLFILFCLCVGFGFGCLSFLCVELSFRLIVFNGFQWWFFLFLLLGFCGSYVWVFDVKFFFMC